MARGLVAVTAAGLVMVGMGAPSASADTVPPVGTPQTVAADSLPTWQINGVVWSQAIVGNTVYVAGNFTTARPPGIAVGGAGQVAAAYAFAYDITTGNRVTSFAPQFNGQTNFVAASPDGKRVYFGGDFTTVNGIGRSHLAAFDTATNALSTTFKPVVGSRVTAITVGASSVYVGGFFAQVASNSASALVARSYFAAFSSTDGTVLPWAPVANDTASAMVLAPDASRVIIAGRFTTINGVATYGMGSVDSGTGATGLPWAANLRIRDAGANGYITTLRTDGTQIYGAGYAFGAGATFEGTFGADPLTGNITFVNDCHGDTYDVLPMGSVLYSASHVHSCEWIGAFKNTSPTWTEHYGTAFTTYATGTGTGPDDYGWNYSGLPAASVLHWFPNITPGNFTGQGQAGWSITGNNDYVAYGGEFPFVNGVAQQGLVRFPRTGLAANKIGTVSASVVTPTALSITAGSVRLSWPAAWDRDNNTLTYNIYRDAGTTPIYTTTTASNFWTLPSMHFEDIGQVPGSVHTYKLKIVDPFGNNATRTTAAVTVATTSLGAYPQDVINDGASSYWRLGEPSGTVANDYAGFSPLTESATVGHGAPGAINADADTASTFDGTASVAATGTLTDGPNVFSTEAWFKTTSTTGGKIIGFGNASTGNSGSYDRHVYMDNAGHLVFGVYNGSVTSIVSAKTYNDGAYHQVVATLSPSGMALFVDGKKVGINGAASSGQPYQGYWRVGQDNVNGWTNQPTSSFFKGTIDDVAIYPTALTLLQVQKHYIDSGRTLSSPAAPADSYGNAVYNAGPDLFWRLDETSGTSAADSSADGGNGGIYTGGITLGQASPVGAPTGKAPLFNGSTGTMGSVNAVNSPSNYTESAWFKTTTIHGGKIVGFGCAQTGLSGCYDRHIYLENDGRVTFGAYNGVTNTTTSTSSYNDNKWHNVVATQSTSDGMKLYVDGVLVGTNGTLTSQAYTGYWRVGGDRVWSGDSNYFSGSIDEVAIWNSTPLTATQINTLYLASPAAANIAPNAVIAAPVCAGLACSFDGSGSNDPDGTIASYAWNFGDSTTGTGATVPHTYAASGTFTVTLTVTDNQGGTKSATTNVTVAPIANVPPTAVQALPACVNLACSFSGVGSTDPDGTVASYAWDFGDGTFGTGATTTHTYAANGTYTAALVVTDDKGAPSAAAIRTFTVAANVAPTAVIASSPCTDLTCSFSSAGSTDPDGTVASYLWNFGDGLTSTQANPPHTYALGGTFSVSLVVTDNQGLSSAAASTSVTVTVPVNPPPVANIATPSCVNLACTFDGSGSTDNGSIASYSWNFGDGSPVGTGAKPAHTYTVAGPYTVTLTVTDNLGGTGFTTAGVTVSAAVNQSPIAVIGTPFCSNLTCAFSGTGSSDPDGSISSYAWDFGDLSTATGATPSHTYTAGGTFTVTLTVTDNQSATTSTTKVVTVTPFYAVDSFARTVATGWGSADLGGAWSNPTSTNFSVGNGVGALALKTAGSGPTIALAGVSSTSTDVQVSVTTDKVATGGGIYANVTGRKVTGAGEYRAKVRLTSTGAVAVSMVSVSSTGVETVVKAEAVVAGLAYTPGTQLRIRFQVTGVGTTTLRAKVWKVGTTEPAAWFATVTDTTAALQVAGSVGLMGYLSGTATNAPVIESFDDFQAGPAS
jgi:PKD repeat protein